MSSLSPSELKIFEQVFDQGGYVLNFNNSSFQDFIMESIGIDVYDETYHDNVIENQGSGSKGKILKYILHNEEDGIILKLLTDLTNYLEYYNTLSEEPIDNKIINRCYSILDKYSTTEYISNYETAEEQILKLIADINESINKKKPNFALDRLHTLMNNYVKELCEKHNIEYNEEERLDKLFKNYVEFINKNKYIDSKMSKTILKSNISLLSQFNKIRNNHTYAHDNPILNDGESMLIFKNIANLQEFIIYIEKKIDEN